MKRLLLSAALAVGAGAPAVAHDVSGAHGAHTGPVVVVSCYRGPWAQIIWDHPQAPFVDSLVNIGYSFSQATAIAERVCRDQTLVGNPDGLKAVTREIIATSPRY
ncbi:hypothetical protein [Palleronia abyssalis]|nr:hypothetical protein [Palleronia abyssalis]